MGTVRRIEGLTWCSAISWVIEDARPPRVSEHRVDERRCRRPASAVNLGVCEDHRQARKPARGPATAHATPAKFRSRQ